MPPPPRGTRGRDADLCKEARHLPRRERGPVLEATRNTILLVDDEPLVLRTTAELLADGGYNVVSAGGYDEALACLAAEAAPDVLVTDIRLGGPHDGIELACEAARRRPDLRIVIVSGEVRPQGGDYPGRAIFFTKPYAPGALLAIVADGEAWDNVAEAQPSAASVVTPA